jgi:hypothetical protein
VRRRTTYSGRSAPATAMSILRSEGIGSSGLTVSRQANVNGPWLALPDPVPWSEPVGARRVFREPVLRDPGRDQAQACAFRSGNDLRSCAHRCGESDRHDRERDQDFDEREPASPQESSSLQGLRRSRVRGNRRRPARGFHPSRARARTGR